MSFGQRCQVTKTAGVITVFVDRVPWLTFEEGDVACQRLAMVHLAAQGVGTHEEIAAAFGLKSLSVDRFRKAFRQHGLAGLLPKRKGPKGPRVTGGPIDQFILMSKHAGRLPTEIAAKLAISRPAVIAALRRLGVSKLEKPTPKPPPPVAELTKPAGELAGAPDPGNLAEVGAQPPITPAIPVTFTMDTDPSNRSLDRALARAGVQDDASPLFADAEGLRDVGALLAIPVLTQQGVFYEALRAFDAIGPAFYGLRTTIVGVFLLMMLNLSRPQDILQREPRSLGRLLGLDRSPEVKTLRRKLHTLAEQARSLQWMHALARRQLDEPTSGTNWIYLDGHVSVYSGKYKMREHHVACLRAARPSIIDYWVNQPDGEPLLVITGAPKEGLVRQIPETIETVRSLAPGRPVTIVFDREGWSPQLFAVIKQMKDAHFLSYRKAARNRHLPRVAESLFSSCAIDKAGRTVKYDLADTRIRVPYGTGKHRKLLELRQITRRKADGKQTHIVTDDEETPAVELALRMFGRWSQENYFKYAGEHRDLDAMITRETEPAADGSRLVPNPERALPKAELAKLRVQLRTVHEHHGSRPSSSASGRLSADAAHAARVNAIEADIARAQAKYDSLAARVPWSTTDKGHGAVQPRAETRRLMHVFRIAAHRAESGLLELLRPHFADWRHEGCALTRAILQSRGHLRVTDTELHVTLDPLAQPYKTRALAALCKDLTRLDSVFPGTNIKMVFHVREE
jgi:hypothetical protein